MLHLIWNCPYHLNTLQVKSCVLVVVKCTQHGIVYSIHTHTHKFKVLPHQIIFAVNHIEIGKIPSWNDKKQFWHAIANIKHSNGGQKTARASTRTVKNVLTMWNGMNVCLLNMLTESILYSDSKWQDCTEFKGQENGAETFIRSNEHLQRLAVLWFIGSTLNLTPHIVLHRLRN